MKKVISRRIEKTKPKISYPVLNLGEFYEKRNKILIVRDCGGLGDIFMHRMMFEDFQSLMPLAEIHFACPKVYHDALIDHPFLAKILDSRSVDSSKYIIRYNTSTICGRYESSIAPRSDLHRSDIWAKQCGINLKNHNMYLSLTDEEKQWGKNRIEKERTHPGPTVCISPISSTRNKDMSPEQLDGVIRGLKERGCNVVGLHNVPIKTFTQNNVPCINKVRIREWMAVIYAADYIISVDTATFHCAGGFEKPLVGMFTWADGLVYGKYFDFCLVQRHRAIDPTWTCGPCYNWHACPKTKDHLKPCVTEITSQMILEQVDKMFEKWPNIGR